MDGHVRTMPCNGKHRTVEAGVVERTLWRVLGNLRELTNPKMKVPESPVPRGLSCELHARPSERLETSDRLLAGCGARGCDESPVSLSDDVLGLHRREIRRLGHLRIG